MKKRKYILFILFSLILTSCSSSIFPEYNLDPNIDYSTYNEYKLDNFNNLYSQEEDIYAVYVYNTDCNICSNLKNTILGYLGEYKSNTRRLKLYLYNSYRLKDENINYLKELPSDYSSIDDYVSKKVPTKVEDTLVDGVPSLYVIRLNKLIELKEGYDGAKYLFNNTYDSRSYDIVKDYYLDDLDKFYTLSNNEYIIYLYFKECPFCMQIRTYIYDYLLNDHNIPLYLFNMNSFTTNEGKENRSKFNYLKDLNQNEFTKFVETSINNGVNKVEDTPFKYVPALYFVKNNKLSRLETGADTIPDVLKSLK